MIGYFALAALLAGAAIATQAGMNARLGSLLDNALIGTAIAFAGSCLFTVVAVVVSTRRYPSLEAVAAVPLYLWFAGGLFAAFGVGMFYYLIPRMGLGPMMAFALCGQMTVAMLASHYGWFSQPVQPLTTVKGAGLLAMLTGILLINWEH